MSAQRINIAKRLREAFSDRLDAEFKKKFRRNLVTSYNLFAMRLVSTPKNGKLLTVKQKAWIEGFSEGFYIAMNLVHGEA